MPNKFNPDMVVLAREASDMTQLELAEVSRIPQPKLSKLENGIFEPSPEEVTALATALKFEPEFFFQTDKIYGLGSSLLFNRKKRTVTVGVQRRVQANVNVARMQIDRLLRGAEVVQVRKFMRLDIDQFDKDTEEIARRVRAAWNVPVGPIANLTKLVEGAGGIVIRCDFGIEEIDATHLWLPDMPPLFFVNSRMPPDRYRFTLAHEVGHAVMHEHPTGDIEKDANQFARALLMPADQIGPQLVGITVQKAARLKPHWKVSISALIVRAHDLGMIDDGRYESLFKHLSALGYRRNEPVPIPQEVPEVLSQLMQIHQTHLGYGPQEMVRLLFTSVPRFVEVLGVQTAPRLAVEGQLKFPPLRMA